jgi:hypothetical protein
MRLIQLGHVFIVFVMMLYPLSSSAQLSVNIGINLPVYPELVVVPGYPVYYAPQLEAHFFFYDGMYWVYQSDNWYTSSWYNGPWWPVSHMEVPLFVLRIPVYYYRKPPAFFIGWRSDAPPRWGERWGHDWEAHRGGWDRWNRRTAPAPAPLPVYQRQYSRGSYPQQVQQQRAIQQQHYHFQSRDPAVRQNDRTQSVKPVEQENLQQRGTTVERGSRQPEIRRPHQQDVPAASRPQVQRQAAPIQEPPQNPMQRPGPAQREQQHGEEGRRQQGVEVTREPRQGQGRNRND